MITKDHLKSNEDHFYFYQDRKSPEDNLYLKLLMIVDMLRLKINLNFTKILQLPLKIR